VLASVVQGDAVNCNSTTTDASVTVSIHTGGYKVRLMVLPVRVYDEELLRKQMLRMFDHEFSEDRSNADDKAFSAEDELFLDLMKESAKKVDGHYQLSLPWKDTDIRLPFNRSMALKRLQSLKRKFERDDSLFALYQDKMDALLRDGYAKKFPDGNEVKAQRTWYVPHHWCNAAGKFRVVHDCAAVFGGTSLNENLLQGPDLTNTLLGVLLRFRQGKVAFTGNVKTMFFQAKVDPRDCDSLRFLWWPSNDLSKPAADYQMLVHLFGATSSPSCASYALRRVADDNVTAVSADAVSTVKNSFYVDDCVKSVDTDDIAIKLPTEVKLLLDSGGFKLTKFSSNSKKVLLSLSPDELAPALKDLEQGFPTGGTRTPKGYEIEHQGVRRSLGHRAACISLIEQYISQIFLGGTKNALT